MDLAKLEVKFHFSPTTGLLSAIYECRARSTRLLHFMPVGKHATFFLPHGTSSMSIEDQPELHLACWEQVFKGSALLAPLLAGLAVEWLHHCVHAHERVLQDYTALLLANEERSPDVALMKRYAKDCEAAWRRILRPPFPSLVES